MTCQTCGNPHQEHFCPNCGEKRHDPHSLSLKHVVEESLESFTHADHNLLRTVRAVLLQPGKLPAEYVAGRRIRYMKPLGFFLVVNLVFFLLSSTNVFNQPLSSFLTYSPYIEFGTNKTVNHLLTERHETLLTYTPRFNAAMTSSSKGFLVLLIPLYALVFSLIFVTARRTFIEHLLFATYFMAFMLLYMLVVTFLVAMPIQHFMGIQAWVRYGDGLVSFIILFALAIYLFIAFRRFYRTGVVWSLLAAMLSSVTLAVLVFAYRMVLFYKIVYAGH
ncbi:DUF3667 domain-containing protein [Fibrella sp. HMF5335]|uniref:DUF3667 domain-containing protein n=1 Tax=Fibrella rubiginis TaxID=2817060 RepID=A0A939GCV1_9BACT|nr:DUF3667 domain-containing protein [Fibrella rubiginis]MBO0935195.1 DUF3667 domain-containing protein [Fibrella rubiginis]